MKIFFIILGILLGLFLIFQTYTTMSISKTESQPYTLIKTESNFEIRYYPAAIMATLSSSSTSYREIGRSGFGKLANYIFGGNQAKKQIPMTSPVRMEIKHPYSTMTFVLPSNYQLNDAPMPLDSHIKITTSSPEYIAAIRFGGFASNETITKNIEILANALREKGLSFHGNFQFLGYNPPYQLIGRRNEVIVALNESAALSYKTETSK